MRIIAGDYKGRRLYAPKDYKIRPTSDKVKEAVFSILGDRLIDSVCCDLFSGTGNLGLEALSRGADKCYFGDHSGEAIKLIKDNVDMCRAGEYSVIVHGDMAKTISTIKESVDIFFLDPPYDMNLWSKAMELIAERNLLARDGIIVCEHRIFNELEDTVSGFEKFKERRYGKVVISMYK